jgi:hypothetical protein
MTLSPAIFFSPVDFINQQKFSVSAPASYGPLPAAVLDEDDPFPPIFVDPDPHALCRGMWATCHLIDMTANRVPWIIHNDADVFAILHHLDAYLEEVYPFAQSDETHRRYANNAMVFRGELVKCYKRISARSAMIKDIYETGGSGTLKLLLEFLTARGKPAEDFNAVMAPTLKAQPQPFTPAPGFSVDIRPLEEKLFGANPLPPVQYL